MVDLLKSDGSPNDLVKYQRNSNLKWKKKMLMQKTPPPPPPSKKKKERKKKGPTRTNSKTASICLWWHWWRTNKKAAIWTKRGSVESKLDADGWKRVIVSSYFGAATSDFCKATAELVKKLCIKTLSNNNNCGSVESLMQVDAS